LSLCGCSNPTNPGSGAGNSSSTSGTQSTQCSGGGAPPQGPAQPPQPPPQAPPPPVTVTIQEKPKCCVFVPAAGQNSITLHAQATPDATGMFTWTATDATIAQVVGAGATATVTGLQPGITNIQVSYNRQGAQAQDTTRCIAYGATIQNPTGDPVNAPANTNQFTYSNATPGVLTIQCQATVLPNDPDATACANEHLRWTISAVGNSTLAWSVPDPGNAAQGKGTNTTATFTGLPPNNTDFGTKTVTLTIDTGGVTPQTTTIEVFWPKAATNHPNPGQGATPNWYFYWAQVIGNPAQIRYGGAGPGDFGMTLGMTDWTYAAVPDKTLVHIYDPAATSDIAIPGLHGPLSGIDLFENTVLHETEHTQQIARADPVVGIHAGTCWQFGWSWNTGNHNHWQLAAGRVAGGGGICTTAGPGTMGAPGSGDTLLAAIIPAMGAGYVSWPAAWGPAPAGAAPGGGYIGNTPIEQQAYQQETSAENTRARQDWGDPGKNHQTLNQFDD